VLQQRRDKEKQCVDLAAAASERAREAAARLDHIARLEQEIRDLVYKKQVVDKKIRDMREKYPVRSGGEMGRLSLRCRAAVAPS
jgi:hypothetical protein